MLDDAQWPAQKWLEMRNKYLTGTDLASTFTWLIEHLWHVLEKQVWPAKDTPHSFEDCCLFRGLESMVRTEWRNKDQENCFLFFTITIIKYSHSHFADSNHSLDIISETSEAINQSSQVMVAVLSHFVQSSWERYHCLWGRRGEGGENVSVMRRRQERE